MVDSRIAGGLQPQRSRIDGQAVRHRRAGDVNMTVRAGRATAARSGPLQRLASLDLAAAQHVLETAALLIVPDDLTQRRAFERLMPNLYVLRNKGFTWGQMSIRSASISL